MIMGCNDEPVRRTELAMLTMFFVRSKTDIVLLRKFRYFERSQKDSERSLKDSY